MSQCRVAGRGLGIEEVMKQSEIYRQNAENCGYLAEGASNEPTRSGTGEWKQLGEH